MGKLFGQMRRRFGERGDYTFGRAAFELLDGFLYSTDRRTQASPHVRDDNSVQRYLNSFVIASLPCMLIGVWNIGQQTNVAMAITGMDAAPGWRGTVLASIGYDPSSIGACLVHGLLYFAPIFVVALLTGAFWEALFASRRKLPVDTGLLHIAWLFALILPATVPMLYVVLGMSFGLVVGKAIFGGSGRYLVSPVVLAVSFLVFSYSNAIYVPGSWIPVPGFDEPTTIELSFDEGGVPALISVGYSWAQMFIGNQPGPIGITSILGCLLGAIYLVAARVASWRIMLGSLFGMVATVYLFNVLGPADNLQFAMPWTWHLVIGGWAFGTVFLATDPVVAATTNPGRWIYGVMVGALTVVVRVTNPSYYDGVIFALLLASVFAPVFDYFVVEQNIRRRRSRLESLS